MHHEGFAEVLDGGLGEKRKRNFSEVNISSFVQDLLSPFLRVVFDYLTKKGGIEFLRDAAVIVF